MKKQKKKQPKYSGLLYFLLILAILLSISTVSLLVNVKFQMDSYPNVYNVTLEYEGLDLDQIERINRLMEDLDPHYLINTQKIVFTNDISDYCDKCAGQNTNNGEVIHLGYYSNDDTMKTLICHELFHSIILMESEEEEYLVEDLDLTKICFYSEKWKY